MEISSSRGSRAAGSTVSGFSLIEAMVSITILGLLAVAVVVNLNATSRTEALNSAARLVLGDLRALQTRALTAQNIKTCVSAIPVTICEGPGATCIPCTPAPPFSFGAHFTQGTASYILFAEPDQTTKNWMETTGEAFATRDLTKLGGRNVIIDALFVPSSVSSVTDAQIAFERQNGRMHVNPCMGPPCTEAGSLTIRLKQTQTGAIRTVTLGTLTGRMSLD
mgnify:CR=1 FL=1